MKHIYSLLFLVLFFQQTATAQTCGVTDVTLSTQAQVDTFVSTYSGTCTSITGYLFITGSVTDISGLSFLTDIGTFILVRNTTSLTSLNGLQNINSVGQYVSITGNTSLLSVAMNNLLTVTNYIDINNNTNLNSISFSNLTQITNFYLRVFSNPSLSSINFTALQSLGSYLQIQNSIMTSLSFPNLQSVGSYVTISNNGSLSDVSLNNLTSVLGYVRLFQNALQTVSLPNLVTVDSYFDINNEPNITSLDVGSLTNLTGSFTVSSVSSGVSSTSNYLRFSSNANFTTFDIGAISDPDYIYFSDNDAFNDFSQLDNITSTSGYIFLNGDFSNVILDNITSATYIAIGSPNIINVSFANISTLAGSFSVSNSFPSASASTSRLTLNATTLSSIDVGSLTSFPADITISNTALTNLDGLSNVTDTRNLYIDNNNSLTDFSGMGLTTATGVVRMNGNYTNITNPNLDSVTGYILIASPNMETVSLTGLNSVGQSFQVFNYNTTAGNSSNRFYAVGSALTTIDIGNLTTFNSGTTIVDTALTDLSGLDALTTTQNLAVVRNANLTSLAGLSNVTSSTQINISDNPSLTSLAGLENVTTLNGGLIINDNDILTDVSALNNLTSIGSLFQIRNNASLSVINGFTNLTTVFAQVLFSGIFNSVDLNTITTFSNRVFIDSPNLTSVSMSSLSTSNSVINIYSSANGGTTYSSGRILNIDDIPVFTNINLPLLTSRDTGIYIDNTGLTDLSGLNNITGATGTLVISDNDNLTSLNGLSNITTATNITIGSNNALANLSGLSGLTTVSNTMTIFDNALFTDLSGLGAVDFNGTLSVASNPALTSLAGIENAVAYSSLNIDTNDLLTDVSAIDFSKFSGGGTLTVNNNAILETFTVTNPDAIEGGIAFSSNAMLNNIDVLDDTFVINGDWSLQNNTALNECCVAKKFLSGDAYLQGDLTVSGNNTDCENISAIYQYCEDEEPQDNDKDGALNASDNCPDAPNEDQVDTDTDGVGDACDNCPDVANADQADADNDGIGDVCEGNTSADGGGVGINTTNPTSALEVAEGDIFINSIHRGIIMKAANGKCFRYLPNEKGELIPKEITCPDN